MFFGLTCFDHFVKSGAVAGIFHCEETTLSEKASAANRTNIFIA